MSLNVEDIINQIRVVEETNIQKEKNGYKGDPRILKFKKNCTYVLRLIPYIKDVNNTFVTYKEIGFKSRVDGSYVYCGRAPQDAGIKDDVFKKTQWEHYSKAKEKGDEVEQKASYKLLPQRKQLCNAYLVSVEGDDAEAKEKVKTVVAFPYPAQVDKNGVPVSDIYKKIHSSIFGDMSKKIGSKALDLSEKGRSLIVKVTEKAGYNNYSETTFDDAEDLGLSKQDITKIIESAHNLLEFVPEVKSTEEAKAILDKHWFGNDANLDDELEEDEKPSIDLSSSPEDDEIPMGKSSDKDELDILLEE